MLLSETENVAEAIVRALAEQHSLSAQEIQLRLEQRDRKVTIQAVYKELRKLLEIGVAWKKGSEYGLSASWILNFSELADTMYNTFSEQPTYENFLPAENGKQSFRFSSLARLDDFWIHLIFVFMQHSKRKQMYQWFPHPWFNLIHSHKSYPLQRALKAAGYCVNVIVGGDTFLDKRASKIQTTGAYEFSYAPSVFQAEQGSYYAASDSFLFRVEVSDDKVRDIEDLYASVDSLEDLDISAIVDVVNKRCEVKATVETGTKRHRKIWNKFVDYFEVSKGAKV